jgi:hypothetical protein
MRIGPEHIDHLLRRIEELEIRLMAAIDDLATAVQNVANAEQGVANLVAQLRTTQGTPDEQIAPLVAQVQGVADSLNALVTPPA